METIFVGGHGECQVWNLPKVSSSKQREFRYCPQSFEHPAKMNLSLCRKIIETYTRRGELILDPMAGIGSTLVESNLLGRNAVGVELEKRFVKLTKRNIKMLERLKTMGAKGNAAIFCGDARKLTELLSRQADSIVFSPPYSSKNLHERNKKLRENWQGKGGRAFINKVYGTDPKNIGNLQQGEIDAVVFSPPFKTRTKGGGIARRWGTDRMRPKDIRCDGRRSKGRKRSLPGLAKMSEDPRSVDNRPYGKEVDAIVTSPPYIDTKAFHDLEFMIKTSEDQLRKLKSGETKGHCATPEARKRVFRKLGRGKIRSQQNIANLPIGKVDAVITSPPFSEAEFDCRHGIKGPLSPNLKGRRVWEGRHKTRLRKDNIGRLKHGRVDAIVTSPPYSVHTRSKKGTGYHAESHRRAGQSSLPLYSDDPSNIGNLRRHGEFDAVVTSPPYPIAREGGGLNKHPERCPTLRGVLKRADGLRESRNPASISNLPHTEVDAIITSPPYEDMPLQDYGASNKALLKFERTVRGSFKRKGYFEFNGRRYTEREWRRINKGELKPRGIPELWRAIVSQRRGSSYSDIARVDAIVTSPPYSEFMTKRRKGYTTHPKLSKTRHMGADSSDDNIGNLPHGKDNIGSKEKDTYLSAMLAVYRECFGVLKGGGLMVIVVKDFVRQKKVVRLDLDTKKLCEAVGFVHVGTKLFRLKVKSFWRILYSKKHPEVDTSLLNFEFVEIFRKPSAAEAM